MKFEVDGFEITISARRNGYTRKEATSAVLNMLCLHAWNAKERNLGLGYEATASRNRQWAIALGDASDALEEGGKHV